ncbi:MAG: hypothetical protein ACR2LU_11935 [Luteitalea sp.]
MSGVVLRCRTCGTTQDHPGECDACSEGPVAYFCGDHNPGLWLDEPVCGTCGARYGDARAKPAPPASRTSSSIPRSGTRRSSSTRATSSPARPASPGVRRIPTTATPPLPGRVTDPDEAPDTPSLADLLVDMAEEGRRARGIPEEMPPWASTAPPRAAVPIFVCLFRLFLLLVLLALVAVAAVSLLLSGAF